MAGQGRKRKPDALKIVQGTFRKDRENKLQPKPKAGIPVPARGLLDKDEKKQFDRLCKILNDMNVLAESDVIAVEILAQSLADYYEGKSTEDPRYRKLASFHRNAMRKSSARKNESQ